MADTEKKMDAKPAKPSQKKPNIFVRACTKIKRWFKDMKVELKKVVWPTRKDTLKSTGVVILCVIVVGIFIWVFDWLAAAIVKALLDLFT